VQNVSEDHPPLSGRRRQAALNDDRILDAAREVFIADPAAPIAEVAKRAGVGISALYRRYPSKEELLRVLCADGQQIYLREVRRALDSEGDPWEVYAEYLRRLVAEDTHALGNRLAGRFTPTESMFADATVMRRLSEQLFNRVKHAGGFRAGLTFNDVASLMEAIANVRVADAARTSVLQQRMLAVLLEGIRPGGPALPGKAPTWEEMEARWRPED
jgi:AcrR family transcriptional regulator